LSEPGTSRARILIVEDMAVVALDIECTLVQLGHQVIGITGTGPEAVRMARQLRPDLVLMDINLLGPMDGIEAALAIHAEQPTPVVYLTAYTDDDTLQRAKLSEPLGYVVKPVNKRELEACIQMALYHNQVDEAWRASEERYSAVVRQGQDGIWLIDVDGRRVLEANPAAQRLSGYDADDIEALTLEDLLPYSRALLDRGFARVLAGGTLAPVAGRLRRRDGQRVPVDYSATAITYAGSQAVCLVVRPRPLRRAGATPTALAAQLHGEVVRLRQLATTAAAEAAVLPASAAALVAQAEQVARLATRLVEAS
jgi:PAS domain S-box-containing protein